MRMDTAIWLAWSSVPMFLISAIGVRMPPDTRRTHGHPLHIAVLADDNPTSGVIMLLMSAIVNASPPKLDRMTDHAPACQPIRPNRFDKSSAKQCAFFTPTVSMASASRSHVKQLMAPNTMTRNGNATLRKARD